MRKLMQHLHPHLSSMRTSSHRRRLSLHTVRLHRIDGTSGRWVRLLDLQRLRHS
ncbi:unnamed protein product [Taenia asiatica]|uniref:Uncharacterized protein n=1 Tax=Taenia asiatica TaxID=60517 RepID=A0A0R3W0G2_TAEAS|nr:unnamed protein product [Taenia asiatica]